MSAAVSAEICDYIASASTASFDEEIRERARLHVLDTIASIVACRDLEPALVARRYALANSGSDAGTTILGTCERASLTDAVFASAMAGHGAEINDFIPSVFVQPGPAVVATALCLAEQRAGSGDAVLRSVIVGYELAARVPRALGVENLRRAGIANHGVGPVFGAAATASSLLGLDARRVDDVLSCCAQQASGSWQWLSDVAHIEKSFVFAGMGARNGLQAALLVEAGYRGVPESFDLESGWLRSGLFRRGDADPAELTRGLDAPSALHDAAFKRYPVGGPAQPAVQALLDALGELDRRQVAKVVIAMPGRADAFRDAAMPALNLRYLTALILSDGRLDFEAAQSLDRMRTDPRIAALMRCVEVVHDPAQEAGSGRERTESARVTLTLRSGEEHTSFVPHVRGFPSHPMERPEIEEKAIELMTPELGAARAGEVVVACRELEQLADAATTIVPLIGGS